MQKDDAYYFHQTPDTIAPKLIAEVPLEEGDRVLEPFRGEGSFFNNLPSNTLNDWCEILDGRDFKDYKEPIDWVVSNPPFRLECKTGRVNSFYYLVEYYASRVNKGIAFLGNDSCFSTLTPKRLHELQTKYNLYIDKIVVCNIKKWRGRYFWIIFKKGYATFYKYLVGSY
jgi:hypothetical protein